MSENGLKNAFTEFVKSLSGEDTTTGTLIKFEASDILKVPESDDHNRIARDTVDLLHGLAETLSGSSKYRMSVGFLWALNQLEHEEDVTIWSLFDVLYRALDHVPDIEQMDRDHRLLLIKALDFARFVGHVVAGEKLGPDIVVPLGELTDGEPGVSMPETVTPESKLPADVTADEVIESMAMAAGIHAEEETRRTLVDAVLTRRGLVRGIKVQS